LWFKEFAQQEEQKDAIEQVQPQLSDLKNTIYTPDKQSLLDQQFDDWLPYFAQAWYQQRDLSAIA
jgi:hypothetical protein